MLPRSGLQEMVGSGGLKRAADTSNLHCICVAWSECSGGCGQGHVPCISLWTRSRTLTRRLGSFPRGFEVRVVSHRSSRGGIYMSCRCQGGQEGMRGSNGFMHFNNPMGPAGLTKVDIVANQQWFDLQASRDAAYGRCFGATSAIAKPSA